MSRILIVEDDRELRQLFTKVLQKHGFSVKGVENGLEGLQAVSEGFDLVVSDVMMPVMDGFDMVRRIRESGNTIPVLMITAKDTFNDMRQGFLCGTDDFMVKPVNLQEMIQRIRVLLRRARSLTDHRQMLGQTVLECDSCTVTEAGRASVLPRKEFALLYKMASSPGRIFTRQQLMDDSGSDSGTVEACIQKLRERFSASKDFRIVTMQGIGYKVVPCS